MSMDELMELEENQLEQQEDNMPCTLEEFLSENPIQDETEELVLCQRLENFTFTIGTMTKEQRNRYTNACLIKGKKGQILRQDIGKFNELIVVNHCLYPDFNNLEFIRKCGCNTPAEALYKVLKVGEVEMLSEKIMEFNGFDDFDELRKQAKN